MSEGPYWITEQMAIVERPQGDVWASMQGLRDAGVTVVVSLLEPYEAELLGLEQEASAAQAAGIHFVSYPIPDGGVPAAAAEFERLLSELERAMDAGGRVGVHCRAGIGRSAVVAASLLVRAGASVDKAWRTVEQGRGQSVPDTLVQQVWVGRAIRPVAGREP